MPNEASPQTDELYREIGRVNQQKRGLRVPESLTGPIPEILAGHPGL